MNERTYERINETNEAEQVLLEDNYSNTRTRRNRDTAQHPLLNWSCSGMLSCSRTPDFPPAQAALSEGKPGKNPVCQVSYPEPPSGPENCPLPTTGV